MEGEGQMGTLELECRVGLWGCRAGTGAVVATRTAARRCWTLSHSAQE